MKLATALAVLLAAAPLSVAAGPDPAALAGAIDRLVAANLSSAGVSAAPPADDATYFRRIHLALAGRIPRPAEVRAFLADPAPDKRAAAVDRLLASPEYAAHMARTWRGWLLPEAATDPQVAAAAPGFEAWLRARIAADTPHDRVVRELLAAPLGGRPDRARGPAPADPDGVTNPLAFYVAKDGKPENLAAATARVFLGVPIDCAQCHDHPFAPWTRDQFWGLAAFFAGVERPAGAAVREVPDRRELVVPGTDRAVPARFLDDTEPAWGFRAGPRAALAAWVTAADNPFFARAAANRVWAGLMGVGVVDPVDDFHDQNPPSHPALLAELARAFVASGYDTKYLVRAVCRSDTFGRAGTAAGPGPADARLFARFPVQGMTPDQLFDSLAVATGGETDPAPNPARQEFLDLFALGGRRTDAPTTILQALTLMNGGLVGAATTPGTGRTLAAVAALPGATPAARVEELYLAALGRPPRAGELRRALAHVAAAGPGGDGRAAADVFWALLNGVEFRTNH